VPLLREDFKRLTTKNTDLSSWLRDNYAFSAPPEISLLRAYTNDVYQVVTAESRCILKVYGLSWRSEDEVRYEIALHQHLDRQGLAVARPLARDGQDFVRRFATPQGSRLAVLFEHAAGEKPVPPFTPALYVLFGEAIGRMHALSDTFSTTYRRKPLDLDALIDQPLRVILPALADRRADGAYLRGLGTRLGEKINRLAALGLDWGPIHGDATLDNLHVVENKSIILYDFDSGGPGWRASDLQGWAIGLPEYQEKYAAFLHGYRRVREIREQDIEASGYLHLAWEVWGMQVDLQNRVFAQGPEAVQGYLSKQITSLQERETFLPM
jgi:Ser/Thr protein kinase RdoA (MazF antagonist)